MGKKKSTTKGTASKAAATSNVNKKQAVERVLAATPDKPPKQISEELAAKGIDVTPAYVSNIKFHLKSEADGGTSEAPKAETPTPKLKSLKAKRTTKKKGARRKKVARKQPVAKPAAPQAAAAGNVTYEQLQQAKELARQLGGLEQAREALSALSNLQE
jgi:hypothetical protein